MLWSSKPRMTRHGGQATDITDVLKMPNVERRRNDDTRMSNLRNLWNSFSSSCPPRPLRFFREAIGES
jgi:hypothetical protein